MTPLLPRFPIYIPSKSRAESALTPSALDELGVPYLIVVEASQHDAYAARFQPGRLLVLDKTFQDDYDTCDDAGNQRSKGPGPARNFIWEHARTQGHTWHWVMDDNIRAFYRLHQNRKYAVSGSGQAFHAMETFVLRYENIGMAGPEYEMFVPARQPAAPFRMNTRIFSCNLIRNDIDLRWRGRYNEDLILSIDMLKAGWCTVLFLAFLQKKIATQQMSGGNTEAFYEHEGTLRKSQMALQVHPDVVQLAQRYGRVHHQGDFSQFRNMSLIRRPGYQVVDVDPYPMRLIDRELLS